MSQKISRTQLIKYRSQVGEGGSKAATAVYSELYAAGYKYPGWAKGVSNEDSITGISAVRFLKDSYYGASCESLSNEQIENIKSDMAIATLDKYIEIAELNGGVLDRDLSYAETRDVHVNVFNANGLSINNWTLELPMKVVREKHGDEGLEKRWEKLRDTGGEGPDAINESTALAAMMFKESNSKDIKRKREADEWLDNVTPGPSDAARFFDFDCDKEKRNPYTQAKGWTPPRDPIVFDLDGDGIETVGLNRNIHFDFDNDGVLTKTGWVGRDDALLVRDINNDGLISSGAELFGDYTLLSNGKYAPNGYAALEDLDFDADGLITDADPAFETLLLWQDLNQDGLSEASELRTLRDHGISSISLKYKVANQSLPGGNLLVRQGEFQYQSGETGSSGELQFLSNTFSTRFSSPVSVAEEISDLPYVRGSGFLRDLHQSAALSMELKELVVNFAGSKSRSERTNLTDEIIFAWAQTSSHSKTMEERSAGAYRVQYDAIGNIKRKDHVVRSEASAGDSFLTGTDAYYLPSDTESPFLDVEYKQLISSWTKKLQVLEMFNGQYFFNIPNQKNQTAGAGFGLSVSYSAVSAPYKASLPTLHVQFSQAQIELLDKAYASLKDTVYSSLVIQAGLRKYLDLITYSFDEDGHHLDIAPLNQALADQFASDPVNALGDLLDLDRYAGRQLAGTNWTGLTTFDHLLDSLPASPAIDALLDEFNVRRLTGSADNASLTNQADIVLAGAGDDTLSGQNGNDRLFGQAGDDKIYAGSGDDLLSGGAGNDLLSGDAGADTYVFGRGYGHDIIHDYVENGVRRDAVRFIGLTPADIRVTADHNESLIFTITDTGETLSVPVASYWWGDNGVGRYVFEDGAVWSHDDALRATVAASTDGDDVIHGSSAGDIISGQAGNDILVGQDGDDVIDGGAGNDLLLGSTGRTTFYENGKARIERNLELQARPNGNDTYLFGRGDGQDTVLDGDYSTGNIDTLRFKAGIIPADIKLTRSATDLVLSINGSTDQVTLARYFEENWHGEQAYLIERIVFADGTSWSLEDVQAQLFAGSVEADTIIGTRQGDYLSGQAGNDILQGRDGDDYLLGGDGDDILLGGAGRDILDGGAGNDTLRGNADASIYNSMNIYEYGNQGDIYRFGYGDGHDTIIDSGPSLGEVDRIELKPGISPDDIELKKVFNSSGWLTTFDLVLTLRSSGETLTVKNHFQKNGFSAVEEIAFADGTLWTLEDIRSQVLIGNAADNVIDGFFERDDLLRGNGGDDRLAGSSGNDHYAFGRGDGNDLIVEGAEANSVDAIVLDAGITAADVTIRWTAQGGMAVYLSSGDSIVVEGQAKPWLPLGSGIEELRFADGTVWDRAQLAEQAIAGTDGDDVIVGGYGDDVFDGGKGNDHFKDRSGYSDNYWHYYRSDDTYRFGIGDGHDTIDDDRGRVQFKAGIAQNDVAFTRDGLDLIATIKSSGDSIRFTNWSQGSGIDRFDFSNGARLSRSDVWQLLNMGNDNETLFGSPDDDVLVGSDLNSYLYGREGNDTLIGGKGRDNLVGESGDDILDGGADRDWLEGGAGNNTYIVSRGMALDYVSAMLATEAFDVVEFAAGIRPEDITVQLGGTSQPDVNDPNDTGRTELVIGIGGDDALRIAGNNWRSDVAQLSVQRFRFADGTEWSLADLLARSDSGVVGWQERQSGEPTELLGSQADDDIYDNTGDSVAVRARGNDDRVYLVVGNDRVSAGSGNDYVNAGGGDDVIAGEQGDDHLDGGDGDDVFTFNYGDGNDELYASAGADTLSFGGGIAPHMLSVSYDEGRSLLLLIDGGQAEEFA